LAIEIDLRRLQGRVLVSWPGDNPGVIAIRFDGGLVADCDICLRATKFLRFSITRFPLLGPVIKAIVVAVIARRTFTVNIPEPPVVDE
jgi:hypothetical protein